MKDLLALPHSIKCAAAAPESLQPGPEVYDYYGHFNDDHRDDVAYHWTTSVACSPAGDLPSTHQHRPPTFKDHFFYKQRDCLSTSVTFCNKKKVLVANAKIIVPPGEVNIAHLQQNALVISQS